MAGERVSIIVPVYNAAAFLRETVASVQAQTYANWELLLVDDCSTDESPRLLRELAGQDERIRPLFQTENGGAAAARNRGIREAAGDCLAFLDADDLWRPRKLEEELAFLRSFPEAEQVAFVFCGYEFADRQGKGTGRVVRVPERLSYRQALKNTTIFTSTVLLDVRRLGKDLIQMPLVESEDTATWWKILRNGHTAYGLDRNLVYYRRGGGTLSSNKVRAIRRIWNLYRNVEGFSAVRSGYYFCFYAVRALLRRI